MFEWGGGVRTSSKMQSRSILLIICCPILVLAAVRLMRFESDVLACVIVVEWDWLLSSVEGWEVVVSRSVVGLLFEVVAGEKMVLTMVFFTIIGRCNPYLYSIHPRHSHWRCC